MKKLGWLVNPVTGMVNGELTLEVFPRKRGYEVIGVLYRPGTGPTFASHGRYPSKAAAIQAMREVFQAMKRNPVSKIAIYPHYRGGWELRITENSETRSLEYSKLRDAVKDAEKLARRHRLTKASELGLDWLKTNPTGLYSAFHGAQPKVLKVKFTPPKPGEKLTMIGRLKAVEYEPEPPSKRAGTRFRHESGDTGRQVLKDHPILAVDKTGKQLYIINDKARPRFGKRGIVG